MEESHHQVDSALIPPIARKPFICLQIALHERTEYEKGVNEISSARVSFTDTTGA